MATLHSKVYQVGTKLFHRVEKEEVPRWIGAMFECEIGYEWEASEEDEEFVDGKLVEAKAFETKFLGAGDDEVVKQVFDTLRFYTHVTCSNRPDGEPPDTENLPLILTPSFHAPTTKQVTVRYLKFQSVDRIKIRDMNQCAGWSWEVIR